MKPAVPIDVAPHIAIKKQEIGMSDTSVPVEHKNIQLIAEPTKIKHDCNELLKEDICNISDTKKLRAYVMCYARRTGDMSKGIKEAWQKRKTCDLISTKSRQQ